ncbi:hypothetical protein [Aestuariivirga sp.]|uniref:hypothetical protein n=1 Tax=Aestuariivirga sp. TaxID=2650926 RepID=UPI003918D67A
MKEFDTNTAVVPPEKTHHSSLSRQVRSWLIRRRMAREIEHLETLPAYLLKDVGLPDLHDHPRDTRRAIILAALRRF